MAIDYTLYLVTDRQLVGTKDFWESLEAALAGGVSLLQLREKDVASRDFYHIGVKLKELTLRYQVPLIVNDRLDIAQAIDADGLHVGQDDLPLPVAREILGKNKIIGYSVSNVEEALYGQEHGADYLGAGPVYATGSKDDAGEAIGLDGLGEIVRAVTIPVVAIGGVGSSNLLEVKGTGVQGVSLISAILSQADPGQATMELIDLWRR